LAHAEDGVAKPAVEASIGWIGEAATVPQPENWNCFAVSFWRSDGSRPLEEGRPEGRPELA
jgi:hypothetical protein